VKVERSTVGWEGNKYEGKKKRQKHVKVEEMKIYAEQNEGMS
jgi:hypothetical protein